jgi:hypothetical protein
VEHAAAQLRWVYDNRVAARALGARANAHVTRVLDPVSSGRRTAGRIRQLFAGRKAGRD